MNILLLQSNIEWRRPEENRRRAGELIAKRIGEGAHPDLILLPEMFTTGFVSRAADAAETDGHTLEWMRTLASRWDAAVAGSVAWAEEGRVCNRLWFVRPDGTTEYYDKRHLFTYSGENLNYAPGDRRVVVKWRGFRILLQVCYDLRFPVFSRNRGDYDLALYLANWPSSRVGAWETLLRARAIENACYVAGVNRAGADPAVEYPGRSAIIDFRGETITEAGGAETCLRATLERASLDAFRTKFPVLEDADGFRLEL